MTAELTRPEALLTTYGAVEGLTRSGMITGRWWCFGHNEDFTWRIGYCAACLGHDEVEVAVKHLQEWLMQHHTERNRSARQGRGCSVLLGPYDPVCEGGVDLG